MKEQVFISVDCGKHSTKSMMEYRGQTYIVLFRTKMQMTNDLGIELQENSYKVGFEGSEHLLGDTVSENHSDHNLSKESLVHKLAIYTAIVELMKKANLQFYNVQLHVAINAPINVYKSQRLKNSYKRYMENNNRTISICINEKSYMFNLNDLTICFEGMGLVYESQKEYSKHSTAIFDIGGLNTTYCTFNGVQPDFNSMIVSNLGSSSLKAKIERELVEKYGMTVSSNDLEQIVQKGFFTHYGKKVEESEELIEKIKKNHLDSIINYAKQHGYTLNQDKIYFVGGGANLLSNEIKHTFRHACIVINPQFANVKSFLEILKVKYA
ncbi:hypothetical protein VBD025_02800 [Virgibacillus flavescens]|uniref:ParM/StbA family protein n=1 Tax=Virgibacillus flavescens TaxID=1611422 RepID=UPI003D3426BA